MKIPLDTQLTKEELQALEEYSCGGAVPYEILQEISDKKFQKESFPQSVVCFGGTFLAKAVIDEELVWIVAAYKKGQFFYTGYADDLFCLLAGL